MAEPGALLSRSSRDLQLEPAASTRRTGAAVAATHGVRRFGEHAAASCLILLLSSACTPADTQRTVQVECDPDNGGITLPAGFCAQVVADLGQYARHIAVRPDGDIVVAVGQRRGQEAAGGVYVLRDTTGDGRIDVQSRFGEANGGTGLAVIGDQVWFGYNDAVVRFTVPEGELLPTAGPDTIVSGLPADRSHTAKSISVSEDGRLYVNIGSPSNSCQQQDRQNQSPGMDPCPELETRAGIWLFDANRTGQTQADGTRFATGIRNSVGHALHPVDGDLWAMQHGRDMLAANWGFTNEQGAETPAEELLRVDPGDDFGWPYCYFAPDAGRKVLAPEYGGDGAEQGRCADIEPPAFAFPAHWAPNALLFYTGDPLPARYRDGVFIAFHGSWNRAPLPQGGYNVVFLPFNAGAPLTGYEVFADGFAGATVQPGEAAHRPTGLAQGPDGSLYITDDQRGRIWRVVYRGE
ncbi:MAG: PQQ-dependent sugar dehydrogenase [Gemmatimonadetes bacterium]|nr:PQQ-dependent sugar dehydrogenase [Gemmatimonadota bacterium]